MRRSGQCSKCRKTTIRTSTACVGCGAPVEPRESVISTGRLRRFWAGAAVLVAMLIALAVNYSDRYVPAVADWYLEMAVPYVGDTASSFAADDNDQRAFYACARSIVKQLDEEGTIATFGSPAQSPIRSLGDGRYHVESYVSEAAESGARNVRSFTCTAKLEGNRWTVEELRVRPFSLAGTPGGA